MSITPVGCVRSIATKNDKSMIIIIISAIFVAVEYFFFILFPFLKKKKDGGVYSCPPFPVAEPSV